MRLQEIRDIVAEVQFRNYHFDVLEIGFGETRILRARFMAKDIVTGKPEKQFTRKWLLSEHMTRSEIVSTALKCVLTSEEHEARTVSAVDAQIDRCVAGTNAAPTIPKKKEWQRKIKFLVQLKEHVAMVSKE